MAFYCVGAQKGLELFCFGAERVIISLFCPKTVITTSFVSSHNKMPTFIIFLEPKGGIITFRGQKGGHLYRCDEHKGGHFYCSGAEMENYYS